MYCTLGPEWLMSAQSCATRATEAARLSAAVGDKYRSTSNVVVSESDDRSEGMLRTVEAAASAPRP
jgi:hypothetical protein